MATNKALGASISDLVFREAMAGLGGACGDACLETSLPGYLTRSTLGRLVCVEGEGTLQSALHSLAQAEVHRAGPLCRVTGTAPLVHMVSLASQATSLACPENSRK